MDSATLDFYWSSFTTRQQEGRLGVLVQILDSFYAVHWEAKVVHDDEKLIVIYCIESGAEVSLGGAPQNEAMYQYRLP